MSTFLQMQNIIQDGYLLRTDLNTYVQTAINRAIAKYSKNTFWFIDSTGTFATVNGTQSYGAGIIPAYIRNIQYLRITVNNVYYRLFPCDINVILEANVNNNAGQPTEWAWFNQSIYLYPTPQAAYTITVYYTKTYAPLVNTTDTNDFTTNPEAEELIENEALYWLYKKVILDKDKAEEYRVAAQGSLKVLQGITAGLTGMQGAIQGTRW